MKKKVLTILGIAFTAIALILTILTIVLASIELTRCTYSEEYVNTIAYIKYSNDNVIKVDVKSYTSFYSDGVKIIAKDGTMYRTSLVNVILIEGKE